jgi:toxin CcdB
VAQFDVHRLNSSGTFVVDCQSDLLRELNTRFVVPLILKDAAPTAAQRLNPIFNLQGGQYVMVTQFAATVELRELGEIVCALREDALQIIGALDVLIGGV